MCIRLQLFIFYVLTTNIISFGAINDVDNVVKIMYEGNFMEAFDQIKRMAGTNNIVAQYYLAQCYEYGIGVKIDKRKAFFMYRRVAERGFASAMLDLARYYRDGIGVSKDPAKATEWHNRYKGKQKTYNLVDILEIYKQSVNSHNQPTVEPSHRVESIRNDCAKLNHAAEPETVISVTSPQNSEIKIVEIPKSEVDINIPSSNKINENTFALIIVNEDYQDVASVPNAINDGEIFAIYCDKSLGLPKSNIHLIKNATLNNIKREIKLMNRIAEAYKGEASFIIYYAGHGIPDEKTQNAYILPIDGYTSDLSTCYSLADFYNIIGSFPSRRVIAFIDACFSGSQRGNGMLADARGIAIKPKTCFPSGNTVVITSAQSDESAYSYEEKKHGLFTYYLLKKLQETNGDIKLGSLVEYLTDNVVKKSLIINGRVQTPMAFPSDAVVNQWETWYIN